MVATTLDINYLGLRSLKEISDGDVFIRKNQKLCYTNKMHWKRLFKSDSQSATVWENAAAADCGKLDIRTFVFPLHGTSLSATRRAPIRI